MLLIGLFSISSGEFLEIVCGATPTSTFFDRPIEDYLLPLFPNFDFSRRGGIVDNLWIAWMTDPNQPTGAVLIRIVMLRYPLDFACVHEGTPLVELAGLRRLMQVPFLQGPSGASVQMQDVC